MGLTKGAMAHAEAKQPASNVRVMTAVLKLQSLAEEGIKKWNRTPMIARDAKYEPTVMPSRPHRYLHQIKLNFHTSPFLCL